MAAEVLTFSNIAGITTLNKVMDLAGMVLFPAITSNLYYHFSSRNFGPIPNIAFRLITSLYVFCVPASTAMPDALLAAIKLVVPLLVYGFIMALFEKKKKKVAVQKSNALSTIALVVAIVIIIGVAMVVSCQFRYGAVVIATESMTGEINKGDVIIYEQYKNQKIEEGQVIVFKQNGYRVIHRVARIETVNNETRYYTKGDANNTIDIGYRTQSDIIGLTDIKIAYIGYPTLWLHKLLGTID
jgi:signal peptidase I